MPYRMLNGIRHVLTLDGEIRGGSFSRALGLVTFGGNNPGEVAFCPVDGKAARKQSVGVDDLVEAATISRDIAVVRAGDAVWALLDIAHKPKVERIVENVRALVAKPAGGSAFALHWDGRASEITPGKNDAAVRELGLRGDVRAIDIGENETVVVMDVGDGELRLHPGATPEQGANARVALPPGSAKLDRVRGARFLNVVYRRNDANVVLVKRAGNRLDPKPIHLGISVCDAGVAETSLVVATPDGQIALYNAEAIDGSTPSLMEPTKMVSLGCQGEPRALVVAGDKVFVGTSSGEIYEAYLVRKSI